MEIRVLRYFLTVAKEQSFTKAAEVLHITQQTLSRQLAGLEKELGVTLFDRSGHHITLTDEGLLLKRKDHDWLWRVYGSGNAGKNMSVLLQKVSFGTVCHTYGNGRYNSGNDE